MKKESRNPLKNVLEFMGGIVVGIVIGIVLTLLVSAMSADDPARPYVSRTAHGSWFNSDDGGSYTISAKGYGALYSDTAFSNEISATENPVEVRSEGYTIEVTISGHKTKTYTMTTGDSMLVSGGPAAYLYVVVN